MDFSEGCKKAQYVVNQNGGGKKGTGAWRWKKKVDRGRKESPLKKDGAQQLMARCTGKNL